MLACTLPQALTHHIRPNPYTHRPTLRLPLPRRGPRGLVPLQRGHRRPGRRHVSPPARAHERQPVRAAGMELGEEAAVWGGGWKRILSARPSFLPSLSSSTANHRFLSVCLSPLPCVALHATNRPLLSSPTADRLSCYPSVSHLCCVAGDAAPVRAGRGAPRRRGGSLRLPLPLSYPMARVSIFMYYPSLSCSPFGPAFVRFHDACTNSFAHPLNTTTHI